MPASVDTLIFLDVDGVLNVGVHDGPNDDVAFSTANLQLALQWQAAAAKTSNVHPVAERILAVAARKLEHGEDGTYEKLIALPDDVSDLLVSRFVKLVQAAGSSCHLVFSSTWRRPKHTKRKQRLETCIAKHMGKPFTFEASTSLREERTPMDRLQRIGEYLVDFCKHRGNAASPALRILVLEDFFSTALCGQECQGVCVDSPEAAERYLAELIRNEFDVKVKIVHTYDSWTTDQGTPIAIGCGLTMEHFDVGLSFLNNLDFSAEHACHNRTVEPPPGNYAGVTEKTYQTHAPFKTMDGASGDLSFVKAIARFLACVRGTCSPCQPQDS